MRTNIDIDDALLDEARHATGLPTKEETVEEGFSGPAGKARWTGDLETSRRGRNAG